MLHPLLTVYCKVMKFYEMLGLSIKCIRLESIYRYSTQSSSSDWLKVLRKKKKKGQAELRLAANSVLI
jgi:hypothetical protein